MLRPPVRSTNPLTSSGVGNGVVSMCRHTVGVLPQSFKCAVEFFPVAGQGLHCLDAHAKSHQAENCWMIGQSTRKLTHCLANSVNLLTSHAAGNINREDN